ncbi:MAG: bifunctional phosphoribosylaminoimidazolecarboxamide formyltransferase/IMP cyclohydrolase [Actinobacteria bacterium]|nr:bifunctional phosphoribosylaminoimidazolecarboxamide formyltransferase/IMP cyclohydrolase [Actinomycetota bacterium]
MKIRRALLSVSDKRGIVELGRALAAAEIEIVSSGGTAEALSTVGVPVKRVADVTGTPEILDGRVKTLHPKIHGGILADRRKVDHMRTLEREGITAIDLVVCNLYPFEQTVSAPEVSEEEAVENIDIGGPAMVRAAAKNFHSVAVVVNPDRYGALGALISATGEIPLETRRELALEAFSHTAAYDTAVAGYLAVGQAALPGRLFLSAGKVLDLRYGENPQQEAALYSGDASGGIATATKLHGKELSYNNLLDGDAALELASDFEEPAAAIIKHSNPCGVAIASDIATAYERALECDRTSAFGGIVALNRTCDLSTAQAIAGIFTEVVIAPGFEADALALLETKKSMRVLRAGRVTGVVPGSELRSIGGGLLVQSSDPVDRAGDAKVVTKREPTSEQWTDLRFAWVVVKHVKSNAIVLARDAAAVGVGAGQMSRVEATELAARRAGRRAAGTVCASDAFFPFRDGLDAAVAAGAVAVIQPGGSVGDDEVIAAADEHGVPMVFTGRRHFRH